MERVYSPHSDPDLVLLPFDPATDSFLLFIPAELQIEILVNLTAYELLSSLALVSRHFARLVATEKVLWKEVTRRRFNVERYLAPSFNPRFDWVRHYREKIAFESTIFQVLFPSSLFPPPFPSSSSPHLLFSFVSVISMCYFDRISSGHFSLLSPCPSHIAHTSSLRPSPPFFRSSLLVFSFFKSSFSPLFFSGCPLKKTRLVAGANSPFELATAPLKLVMKFSL